jgi:2-polyprenyl-6-methoxyphenol hydroxylase-like FAD-dependent oxidoreductase
MPTHDVVIVGGRAAGAATALLLARSGHDVVLVDRASFPSDTISTHQISRPGVVALQRWGLLDAVLASGAPALRQVTFHCGQDMVTRTVRPSAGVDLLVAPRRIVLDALLVEAAVRAGARLRTNVAVTGVSMDERGRVNGLDGHDASGAPVRLRSRMVVGADGRTSTVARAVRASYTDDRGWAGATQYAYFTGLPWRGVEYFAEPDSFAGIFPTHGGEACIWLCTPTASALAARRAAPPEEAYATMLRNRVPQLWERLRRARRTTPVAGTLRNRNYLRQAHGPGWALVGDAGHHRDPITGHGISAAFHDAELLTRALDAVLRGGADEPSALAGYQRDRDTAHREIFDLTCALGAYPPVGDFVKLTRALGRANDVLAAELAARPVPGERSLVRA